MNVENIILLADVIEGKVEPPECLKDAPFSMEEWVHCLAGYAHRLSGDHRVALCDCTEPALILNTAMAWLDIDEEQSAMLFYPWKLSFDCAWTEWATRRQAAAALRRLAQTGEVTWLKEDVVS